MHDSEACPRKSLFTGKAILNANNDYKHISVASGFSENMGLCRGPVHDLQKHSKFKPLLLNFLTGPSPRQRHEQGIHTLLASFTI